MSFALDTSLYAIKVTVVEFLQDGGRGSSPSLSICGCTNCACADLFDSRILWLALSTAPVEESHTQTTVKKGSVDRRHADLHRFYFGLLEAPRGDLQRHLANAFHI